jgi:hypothetical protein
MKMGPEYFLRKGRKKFYRTIFGAIVMDRGAMINYCRTLDKIWELGGYDTFEISPPKNNNVPTKFQKLMGEYELEPDFLCRISDARVWGRHGLPITATGQIIKEPFGPMWDNILVKVIQQEGILGFLRFIYKPNIDNSHKIRTPTFYMIPRSGNGSSKPNFAHWVIENLPQLRMLQYLEQKRSVKVQILIGSNPPDFVLETLHMLGYESENLIHWNKQLMCFDELLIPKLHYIHNWGREPNPQGLEWLREEFKRITVTTPSQDSSRIYLSRQQDRGRKVANYSKLTKLFKKYQIESIVSYEYSESDLISMFGHANLLCGVHGAGLANMIHMKQGKVIEILPNNFTPVCYFIIASELGLDYAFLKAQPLRKNKYPNPKDDNVEVDVNRFERVLRNFT